MSDTTNEEIARRLKQVFINPATAAKVVDAIVPSNKPKGWSRKASAPYYKELYASEIKGAFDALMSDPNTDFLYDYKTFESIGISRTTTYIRVNQSMRYLFERMDPDGKYKKFYDEKLRVTKERNVGIRISVLEEFRTNLSLGPRAILPKSEGPAWKKKMEVFLAEAQPGDDPFVQEGLALNPEEIKEMEDSFIGVRNFLVNITSFSIKIVPINGSAL